MLGSNAVIKLVSTDVKVLGTILVNFDKIKIGLDVETNLVYLDGYFDGYNGDKL